MIVLYLSTNNKDNTLKNNKNSLKNFQMHFGLMLMNIKNLLI